MSKADIVHLMECGGVLVVIYGGLVVLGLALIVICLVGGVLVFLPMETAAYLQGQSTDGGPWLLAAWIVIVLLAAAGWYQYRQFRQQCRSRQAVPEPAPEPTPVPSVLREALQVIEDDENQYGEL